MFFRLYSELFILLLFGGAFTVVLQHATFTYEERVIFATA